MLSILFNSVSNNIYIRQVAGEEASNIATSTNNLLLSERRSRRRRYTFLDEDCESNDELIDQQQEDSAADEYCDFRSYPLNINWKDLDSLQNDAYEIQAESGLVGVSIYFAILACNSLSEKSFKITPPEKKFVSSIAQFYFNCCEKADADSLAKISTLVNKCFPENGKIILLLRKNLIKQKQLPREPGDFGFDPLNLFEIRGISPTAKKEMRCQEINHGRVSMIVIVAYILFEAITDRPILNSLIDWNHITIFGAKII